MIFCNRCGHEYDPFAEDWVCPVCRWKNKDDEESERGEGEDPGSRQTPESSLKATRVFESLAAIHGAMKL